MDTLLSDIKDFLVKLENSQLDIEAGQWQLHMDMAIIRESFKEIRQLRQELDELRVTNTEQLDIIRGLKTKLSMYQGKSREPMPVFESGKDYEDFESEKSCTGFENCEGDEDDESNEGDEDDDGDECGKIDESERRRKTEVKKISSESFKARDVSQYSEPQDTKTIISDKSTNPKDESSEGMRNFPDSDCENSTNYLGGSRDGSPECGEILYRYLKDSAKYSNPSSSSHGQSELQDENTRLDGENKGQCENYRDECRGTIRDECSSPCRKKPREQAEEDSATRHLESLEKMESVLPKGFTSPNFRRKYLGKQGALKNRYRMSEDFKCKYCDRVCHSYLELKTHLRKCATLMSINMK